MGVLLYEISYKTIFREVNELLVQQLQVTQCSIKKLLRHNYYIIC